MTIHASPNMSVSDLCAQFPVSRFVIMRHLNALEDAGLLARERDGKTKYLSVPTGEPHDLINRWLSDFNHTEPQGRAKI